MNAVVPIAAADARLPQSYESAKNALSHCVALDECKSWADKAAALASYAKQANDEELLKMATRIKGRAIRRAGELLQQIEPGQGARDGKREEGARPPLRGEVARDAGMSSHQAKQAVRVANVPREDFDRQVESDRPPTISQLAQQGIQRPQPRPVVDLEGRNPAEFNRALHFVGDVENAARDLRNLDVSGCLPILNDRERARLRAAVATIDAVTDSIITRI